MDLIQEGINKKLIKFDYENKYITYIHQNKRRNYTKPEEKVQAESFVKLVVQYNYAPERIAQFVPVTMGSDTREADIIVYNDDKHTSAHIVVECKKEEVSEREFNQAIEQAFSYAATGTVRAKYFWVTSKIKDEYFQIPLKEPKKYRSVPDVPQYGVDTLAKFKYAKGGGKINGQKLFELEVVTEDKLTKKFKQAHNALWGGGELNPSEAFDELDKLIFCKIWDERKHRKKGVPYDFQIFSESTEAETNKKLKERIHSLYNEGRKEDPEVFKDDIRLSPKKLRSVVSYLESIHLGNTDLDSKGRAFEAFMGSFFRGDFGQYFTPRPIVKFIVDTLPIKNNSLVLDTSCGSGGFLLHALDKIRRQASEYYPKEAPQDGNPEGASHHRHWHDFAEHNLYGIEINEQIARTAKMNMIIHDDGHTNVIAADGLLPIDDIKDENGNIAQAGIFSRTKNTGFAYNRFDFIITNPPFGSSIKQTEQAYMHQYGYAIKDVHWLDTEDKATPRNKQSTEVLFIEQCHKFLTEGGYLAIVIPDGILTNSSLQYVRDDIEDKYRIVAVVSLPQTAFQATGAGVKSSVMFLRKHTAKTTQRIQNKKTELQDDIKDDTKYLEQCQQIDDEKRQHIKDLKGFKNPENLQGTDLRQSEAYKEWKKEVSAEYKKKIEALKETLKEKYLAHKKLIPGDYPIFMAIAEEIGYDATGKEINNNELKIIGQELKRFIEDINKK